MTLSQRAVSATVAFLGLIPSLSAAPPVWLSQAERVVCLGDSITYAGHYIAEIEASLRLHGLYHGEWLNLGLPSETCTGLSEPDHPFPRPDVHERVDRVLAMTRPNVVVICYGMNDGIYHPFDADRFARFQKRLGKLIETCRAAKCRVILLTPPPFDPLPLRGAGKLVPADAAEFSWTRVYEGYADVVATYADWILTLGKSVDLVVDVHGPIRRYVRMKREANSEFVLSGDGVHMNPEGHAVMAQAILETCGVEAETGRAGEALLNPIHERQLLLRDAWLTETGHQRPGMVKGLPIDQALEQASSLEARIAQLVAGER